MVMLTKISNVGHQITRVFRDNSRVTFLISYKNCIVTVRYVAEMPCLVILWSTMLYRIALPSIELLNVYQKIFLKTLKALFFFFIQKQVVHVIKSWMFHGICVSFGDKNLSLSQTHKCDIFFSRNLEIYLCLHSRDEGRRTVFGSAPVGISTSISIGHWFRTSWKQESHTKLAGIFLLDHV